MAKRGRGSFACPGIQAYPLNTKARISSAKAYYQRGNTAKCRGGKKKICRAAKRVGFMSGDSKQAQGWKSWCR